MPAHTHAFAHVRTAVFHATCLTTTAPSIHSTPHTALHCTVTTLCMQQHSTLPPLVTRTHAMRYRAPCSFSNTPHSPPVPLPHRAPLPNCTHQHYRLFCTMLPPPHMARCKHTCGLVVTCASKVSILQLVLGLIRAANATPSKAALTSTTGRTQAEQG